MKNYFKYVVNNLFAIVMVMILCFVASTFTIKMIDDSKSYCFDKNWEFSHINPNEIDIYIFFYPNDYKNPWMQGGCDDQIYIVEQLLY